MHPYWFAYLGWPGSEEDVLPGVQQTTTLVQDLSLESLGYVGETNFDGGYYFSQGSSGTTRHRGTGSDVVVKWDVHGVVGGNELRERIHW